MRGQIDALRSRMRKVSKLVSGDEMDVYRRQSRNLGQGIKLQLEWLCASAAVTIDGSEVNDDVVRMRADGRTSWRKA